MIRRVRGDLLQADSEALVNTVNCVGVMGKGIALQFKRQYPEMFTAYESACRQGELTIGKVHVYETTQLAAPKYIINFPTKQHWRNPSQMQYIEAGMQSLVQAVNRHHITSLALPQLGAGNGGLDWQLVEPRVIAILEKQLPGVDVVLYEPDAPR